LKKGDEGHNFYIILKGQVGVYISKALNKYKNFNYLKEIARLEAGQSFGELALLYNSVRAASIIALESSELIVLNRETFKKYIYTIQTSHLNVIVGFYEHLVLFEKMEKSEMIKLASKSLMKKYPSKTYLIKQNEEASCIFFIKSGHVQITRKIRFKKNSIRNDHNSIKGKISENLSKNGKIWGNLSVNSRISHNLLPKAKISENSQQMITNFEEPSEEEVKNGDFIELDLKIGEMCKGQYFGDFEVIHRKKMQFSVFTLLPTELIMLSEYDFKLQITEEIAQIWLKHMKIYPSDVEIRKKFIETQYWSQYQQRIIGNYLTISNFYKKPQECDRNRTLHRKNAELKVMEKENEEKEGISLKNLMKDLEKQIDFGVFPYEKCEEKGNLSVFSPFSNFRGFSEEKREEKTENFEGFINKTENFEGFMKKKKKFTKIDAILSLQEKEEVFFKGNQKKILPKINRNISHSINDLLNII